MGADPSADLRRRLDDLPSTIYGFDDLNEGFTVTAQLAAEAIDALAAAPAPSPDPERPPARIEDVDHLRADRPELLPIADAINDAYQANDPHRLRLSQRFAFVLAEAALAAAGSPEPARPEPVSIIDQIASLGANDPLPPVPAPVAAPVDEPEPQRWAVGEHRQADGNWCGECGALWPCAGRLAYEARAALGQDRP